MLRGITVFLTVRVQSSTDGFGRPVYTESVTRVNNVLVAPVSVDKVRDVLNRTGHHAIYELAIPKGDAHVWENTTVVINGETYRTIGTTEQGLDDLVPGAWNKKIKVERWNE